MLRLDVGLPRSMRAAWLGCLIPVTVLANLLAGAIGWWFVSASGIGVLGVLLMLPFLILDALIVSLLVQHYRNTYWLDGRVLVRRLVFGRRSYDLSAARISAESIQPVWTAWRGGVLPRLVVQVPGRAAVKVWLRDPARRGALLPPEQLARLAEAIDPSLRHPVARGLRELACDPFGGVA